MYIDGTGIESVRRHDSASSEVIVHGLGVDQWDIQIVADSIHVIPEATYNYSIWAKSDKPDETLNFATWSQAAGEYGAIRPATLGIKWQQYGFQFTVKDTSRYIRGPIHFYGTVGTGSAIWIDNLQITDPNAGKRPLVVEGESGVRGSNLNVLQGSSITCVGVGSNTLDAGNPCHTSRVITYKVLFPDSGTYNLLARIRVDSGYRKINVDEIRTFAFLLFGSRGLKRVTFSPCYAE